MTKHSSWLMAPRDRLRKVSRNYFSVTAPALLLVSHKRLCVIDTNTPCLAVMALSAENLLTLIMHSCIPIPESFPSLPLPLLDRKHVEKRTCDLPFFFFPCTALSMESKSKPITKLNFLNCKQLKKNIYPPNRKW